MKNVLISLAIALCSLIATRTANAQWICVGCDDYEGIRVGLDIQEVTLDIDIENESNDDSSSNGYAYQGVFEYKKSLFTSQVKLSYAPKLLQENVLEVKHYTSLYLLENLDLTIGSPDFGIALFLGGGFKFGGGTRQNFELDTKDEFFLTGAFVGQVGASMMISEFIQFVAYVSVDRHFGDKALDFNSANNRNDTEVNIAIGMRHMLSY